MVTLTYEMSCTDAALNINVEDMPIVCMAASCDLGENLAELKETYETGGEATGCEYDFATSDGFLPAAAAASIAASMAVLLGFLL